MAFFPTTVVVGTDGSAHSRHALEAAAELCRATGSPLHLLHVRLLTRGLQGRPITPVQRETADTEGAALLEREAAAAAELGIEVAGTHLRAGERLEATMTAAASELGAGLLVIGEGGSGRLARLLSDSHASGYATSTLRKARSSVLVVR